MKLKTTIILATCGVLLSAAGAFAIPVQPSVTAEPPTAQIAAQGKGGAWSQVGSRVTAGDTLLVDARLGHATLGKSGRGETYLFAQVTGADEAAAGASATPMNLAVVIDRSGSMKGDRIANAMNAAVGALERMRDGDSITVVSFDTSASVVVPPTRVSAGNRSSIEAAIRAIRLGGDTCISCGLDEGMNQLERTTLGGDRLNRVILLSDGVTNNGVRDMSGMRAKASDMRGRGVTISTIGVDVDFDEKMMAAIANEGNGRHYFVANASGLPAVFAQEFDDLLASVAKESELAIELAPGVEVEEVFDRTFRREGNKIVVPFGTFSAKQEKTVLVKLRVPTDRDGEQPVADLKLAFRDLVKKSDGSCDASLTLAVKEDGSEQTDLDPFVAARLERSRTAQTLTEANKLFEQGRVGDARAKLATRNAELRKKESSIVAAASAAPATIAPRRPSRSVTKDLDDQSVALAEAERQFAQPPPAKAGAPAAGPGSREGKAQVRSNQQKAADFGF
ncbi:MAG: VWA domain-containing protein [Labilithrix sp.]|nr:VWA domain-containing protein [Labilithrix sp.]MCW5816563.1 VWA domain-containing protein [Labilithrix sp.]